MSDRRECTLSSHNAGLKIIYGSVNPKWICISGHDFPHRKGAVRIDNDPPLDTDFDGCISGKHLNRLSSAKKVTLRSYRWPYDYYKDETKSLEGLEPAIQLVTFIRKNIDNLNFNIHSLQ